MPPAPATAPDRHRLSLVPLMVLACTVLIVVGFWWLSVRHQTAMFRMRSSLGADDAAQRVEQYVDSRLRVVRLLRDEWRGGCIGGETDFRAHARSSMGHYPEFQAINWIDADGVIRWVVPEADNRGAVDADLRRHPVAGPVLRAVDGDGEMAVTPPIELLQGGYGFAAYLPLEPNGGRGGYLNGVFRLEPLIAGCLGPRFSESYDVAIFDGEAIVFASAPALDHDRSVRAAETIEVLDRAWQLALVPKPHLEPSLASSMTSLVIGLLLAMGVSWLSFRWARSRASLHVRTAELQAVYQAYPDVQFRLASSGIVVECQTGLRSQLHVPAAQVVGRHVGDVLTPAIGERIGRAIERIVQGEPQQRLEYELELEDGPAQFEARLVPLAGGEIIMIVRNISERKRAESRQQLMMAELDHRVKNTLASILSLTRLTIARSRTLDDFSESYTGRIRSLARTHDALSAAKWSGVDLREIVRLIVTHAVPDARGIRVDGPRVRLPAGAAAPISMTLHELTTNALKYGALSSPNGTIEVQWELMETPRRLRLHWREDGGPPIDAEPSAGSGTSLIHGFIEYELGGRLALDYRRSGVQCTIDVPLEAAAGSEPANEHSEATRP